MTLRLTVLGFELARVTLDIERSQEGEELAGTLVETVVDGVSGWWIARMLKKRR